MKYKVTRQSGKCKRSGLLVRTAVRAGARPQMEPGKPIKVTLPDRIVFAMLDALRGPTDVFYKALNNGKPGGAA